MRAVPTWPRQNLANVGLFARLLRRLLRLPESVDLVWQAYRCPICQSGRFFGQRIKRGSGLCHRGFKKLAKTTGRTSPGLDSGLSCAFQSNIHSLFLTHARTLPDMSGSNLPTAASNVVRSNPPLQPHGFRCEGGGWSRGIWPPHTRPWPNPLSPPESQITKNASLQKHDQTPTLSRFQTYPLSHHQKT